MRLCDAMRNAGNVAGFCWFSTLGHFKAKSETVKDARLQTLNLQNS